MRKKNNPIVRLMKAKSQHLIDTGGYEPDIVNLRFYYNLLNRYVFKGALTKPKLEITRLRGCWGYFSGNHLEGNVLFKESRIVMNNRYPTKQLFLTALAHEMVHQYQWDIQGPKRLKEKQPPNINHNSTFREWRPILSRFGIPLQREY